MLRVREMAAIAAMAWAGGAFAQEVVGDTAFEVATPESQGVPAAAVAALGELVAGYVDNDYAVGAELLIIKNRKIILHGAYGWADRQGDRPWAIGTGTGTVCNIRSMSKPLTGAAAQILIDRGELSLDDPVARYLPGFDNDRSRAITVRQVLPHRSGLPLTILPAIDEYPDLIAEANAAGERGPEFEPGSKFWYSDIGADVVGAGVETITGERLDAFVTREILEPLGMSDSFYALDAADPRFTRIGSLYIGQAGAWTRHWDSGGKPLYPFAWGSQTVYSTPLDYAKVLAMWMDGGLAADGDRLLSVEAVARTLTPVSPMSMLGADVRFPTDFRGLGVYYGQMAVLYCPEEGGADPATPPTGPVILSHSGSDGTMAWAWPEFDLMVLYFTQSRGGTTVLRFEEAVDRLLIHPGESPAAAETPDRFRPYLGVYIANFASFENERFEVLVRNGKLSLDIPSQMVFELLDADDGGRFAFALAPQQAKVSFEIGEDGQAGMLRLHQGDMTFEIPREGTPLAIEQGTPIVLEPGVLESLVGSYHDPETDRLIEIFLDEGVLSVKAPPDLILRLRPVRGAELTWLVKQNPAVTLSFEKDAAGKVVSMTRHIGEATLVMPRRE